jgi:DNA-3-methyladenine glycosylase
MLNLVTGDDGYPAAVLIRGVEGVSGPGRLTKALKIGKELNGKPASKKTGLWIAVSVPGYRTSASRRKIIRTPRIGIGYAEEWTKKPLRFVLKKSLL